MPVVAGVPSLTAEADTAALLILWGYEQEGEEHGDGPQGHEGRSQGRVQTPVLADRRHVSDRRAHRGGNTPRRCGWSPTRTRPWRSRPLWIRPPSGSGPCSARWPRATRIRSATRWARNEQDIRDADTIAVLGRSRGVFATVLNSFSSGSILLTVSDAARSILPVAQRRHHHADRPSASSCISSAGCSSRRPTRSSSGASCWRPGPTSRCRCAGSSTRSRPAAGRIWPGRCSSPRCI